MRDQESTLLAIIPRLRRLARLLADESESADDLVEVCLHRTMADLQDQATSADVERLVYRHLYGCTLHRSPGSSPQSVDRFEMPARNGSVSIEEGLAMLPAPSRLTLLLVVLEGMSYEDVAATVEVSANEVRSRVGEARRWLMEATRNGGPPVGRPLDGDREIEAIAVCGPGAGA